MKKAAFYLSLAAAILAVFAICTPAQSRPDPKPPVPAQSPTPAPEPAVVACPKVEVHGPPQVVRDGQPVKFTANIAGGDGKTTPMFIWTISAGVITSGQGTATIDVDSTGAGVDKSIAASLLIGGFPPECTTEGTATVNVAGPAQKLDEYGTIKDEDETAKLSSFAGSVTPKDQAFVFVYAGRTSPRGHASAELKRIRALLMKAGVPGERLATIDGGFREEPSHELWLVPIGAENPRPSPTVSAKEIVYPKPTPPVKKP